jgi:hypothetical protein
MVFALNELVNGGQLVPNVEGQPPAWIIPPAADQEPNPPFGYVVSFIRHHERGFTTPASRFMHGLCHHYGVELHNFAPNAISQAATFAGICEGFLGILVNWDLWVHLFRAKLHTLTTVESKVSRLSPVFCLSVQLVWDPLPIFVFHLWFSGLRTALGNSTTQAQTVQAAYDSSQKELEELWAAALEACQGVEEGEAQAGSSMVSRLCALGGHVTRCMRRALHLGGQKALGVVAF